MSEAVFDADWIERSRREGQERHEQQQAATVEATAKQTEALADLGFAPAFTTGSGSMFTVRYQATYCLKCGAMVPLLPIHESTDAHPLSIHKAWHEETT